MSDISEHIDKRIRGIVMADLEPKRSTVYLKTGTSIAVGGVASLFICGQFGLGITGFAQDVNHNVHDHAGNIGCAIICGALFAILPAVVLRFFCSPLQFHVIVSKKWQPAALWLAIFGALLAHHGELGQKFVHFGFWLASAYLIYRIIGILIYKVNFYVLVTSFSNQN